MSENQEAQNLTQLLADLVAFKTATGENGPAEECLDFVENYLGSRGMFVARHQSNGFLSLVATSRQTKNPKVLLQAHLDVVPCPDRLYSLDEKDGKLIGRGVFDMKFAGAVFLKVVDEVQDEMSDLDFGIMFTMDEEVGGRDGVGALLELGYRTDVCVLPDAGDNWEIEITQKGLWISRLIAKGVAVHGSRPWEGDNAIHRLIIAVQEIRDLFKDQHAKSDTLSVNKVQGGDAVNQVADWAEATLDIRFLTRDSYEELHSQIVEIADKHTLKIDTLHTIMPIKTDMDNPLVASFLQIAEQIHGSPLKHKHSLGNSDAHYFDEHNIPIILLRPDGGAAHSDSEWIDKAGFERYYQLIKQYVQKEAKKT